MIEQAPGEDALMPEFQRLTEEHPLFYALRDLIEEVLKRGVTEEDEIVQAVEDEAHAPGLDKEVFHDIVMKAVRLHLLDIKLGLAIRSSPPA